MTLARRGRSIAVSGFLLAGAVGIISSTQTWLTVERADAGEAILCLLYTSPSPRDS